MQLFVRSLAALTIPAASTEAMLLARCHRFAHPNVQNSYQPLQRRTFTRFQAFAENADLNCFSSLHNDWRYLDCFACRRVLNTVAVFSLYSIALVQFPFR